MWAEYACGIDPVTGKTMFCLGIPMNNVPISAADEAGTCEVWNCTHDSKPCRGDSDCCHGSCDWTLDGGSLPGVCSDANRRRGRRFN